MAYEPDNNLTPEVAQYMRDKRDRLKRAAEHWPLKVAVSFVRPGHPTHPPGVRQIHLVCWAPNDDGSHCGISVSVLALGKRLYKVSQAEMQVSVQWHLAQVHPEDP